MTFVIYSPALPNQFLDWDDSANFLNNPHFRGLGWERLRWMFTTFLIAHHNLGFVLLRVGDPARASEHFQRVLSEDSGNVDARTYLGEALVQQRKPGEAVPHLELAIRQNPTHMGALTHLGIALVELGRPMEAIPYFQRAIALYQNAPLPRLGLARAYLALGNTAAAKEQSGILRRLNPRLARQLSPPTSAGSPAERR
ncbi:MAG: tetratricopeptide repeat protein [Candidatus Rokuibacteriota bacterium]